MGQGLCGPSVGGASGESGILGRAALEERQRVVAQGAPGSDLSPIALAGLSSTAASAALAGTAKRLGRHAPSALPPHARPFFDAETSGIAARSPPRPTCRRSSARCPSASAGRSRWRVCRRSSICRACRDRAHLDRPLRATLLRRSRPDAACFFGVEEIHLTGAVLGADGESGTTCDLPGRLCAALDGTLRAGGLRRARELQANSAEVVAAPLEIGVLPGMKSAFRAVGVDPGPSLSFMIARVMDADTRMAGTDGKPEVKAWLARKRGGRAASGRGVWPAWFDRTWHRGR